MVAWPNASVCIKYCLSMLNDSSESPAEDLYRCRGLSMHTGGRRGLQEFKPNKRSRWNVSGDYGLSHPP